LRSETASPGAGVAPGLFFVGREKTMTRLKHHGRFGLSCMALIGGVAFIGWAMM
jgi:hypothetical protein